MLRNKKSICVFVVMLLIPVTILATNFTEGTLFRVNAGTTHYIHTVQGDYIGVTNNSDKDILVPNNTPTEINTFLTFKPSQVATCMAGTWTPDSSWSTCTRLCGGGKQYKYFQCNGSTCGGICPGAEPDNLVRSCNTQTCSVITLTGVISVHGNDPFLYLVLTTSGGSQYKVVGSLVDILRNNYQHQTVSLRGSIITGGGGVPGFSPQFEAINIL